MHAQKYGSDRTISPNKVTSHPKVNHNATAKIISVNAKGLNIPEKRSQVLHSMYKLKADIVFIQETDFKTDNVPKFLNHHFPTVIHATNKDSKTKGVSIFFSKNCPFQITDR